MRPGRRSVAGLALALFAALAARAQEKLTVEGPAPATVRLGDRARVTIRIEGRSADPKEPKPPAVPGLRYELFGPTRNSYQFFDGRTLTERSGVQWDLVLQPAQEGTFVVPPFPLWTGTKEQLTPELRLVVKKDLRGEELGWLAVTVEPRRVYVHEPVRIRVEFGLDPGVRVIQGRANNGQVYLDVEVQAPWLEEFPGGERIALGPPQGDQQLIVWKGQSLIPATDDGVQERNGKRWRRFSLERAFLPTRLGRIELSAPVLRYDVLVREGQPDVFGMRRGQQAENFYAYGEPLALEVLPIPEQGRPTPFFGAVGRFSIDAALDRDSVTVGASVKLTLTVSGQGNCEFLRLPALDDLPGFHKLGEAQAKRDADRVAITYDLTPMSTDVREVPPVRWNFFDTTPGVEKFVEVATRALPLQVKPLANGETLAPLPNTANKAVTPGVDDVFDLPPFDGPPARAVATGPAWGWLAVLGPWVVLIAARFLWAAARARAADTTGRRVRAAWRAFRTALDGGGDPTAALAGYLGDRLDVPAAAVWSPDLQARLVAAGLGEEQARAAAALIERGTAARYGGGQGPGADEVRAFVRDLEAARFGARSLWLLPWLMAGALAAPLSAQDDAAQGVAAYRAGDYRAAEAAFARGFAATGDRRLLRAQGNCWFRLGDLPRARWAYESAALGLPRDEELRRNLTIVRTRLELEAGASGFVAELDALRARLSPGELRALCALCMALAAALAVFGWRRIGLRWLAAIVLLPGGWLAAEVLWFGPARPPVGIALQKLAIVAEPRAGMEPVATVRPGVALAVLGGDQGAWVRVAAGDRAGYAPRDQVAVVR